MGLTIDEAKKWLTKPVFLRLAQDEQDKAEDFQLGVAGVLTEITTGSDGEARLILDDDPDDGMFNWALSEVDGIEDPDAGGWVGALAEAPSSETLRRELDGLKWTQ